MDGVEGEDSKTAEGSTTSHSLEESAANDG